LLPLGSEYFLARRRVGVDRSFIELVERRDRLLAGQRSLSEGGHHVLHFVKVRVQQIALVVDGTLELVDRVLDGLAFRDLSRPGGRLLTLFDGLKLLAKLADLLAQGLKLGGDGGRQRDLLTVLDRGRLLPVLLLAGRSRGDTERGRDLRDRDV
jgi:hypothetical protein